MEKRVFEGEIYVRPLDRGIHLNPNGDTPDIYLDEWLEKLVPSYHYADVKITVEATNIRHQDELKKE